MEPADDRKGLPEQGLTDGEDAGVIQFARLKPQDVWALRVRVGQVLSDAAPAPKRRPIDLRTPPRDPAAWSLRK